MKWLDGKKSYIGFVLYGITGLLHWSGMIDDQTAHVMFTISEAMAGIGLSHKAAKVVAAAKGE